MWIWERSRKTVCLSNIPSFLYASTTMPFGSTIYGYHWSLLRRLKEQFLKADTDNWCPVPNQSALHEYACISLRKYAQHRNQQSEPTRQNRSSPERRRKRRLGRERKDSVKDVLIAQWPARSAHCRRGRHPRWDSISDAENNANEQAKWPKPLWAELI